nr:hypothetical protein [Nocardia wallacei]
MTRPSAATSTSVTAASSSTVTPALAVSSSSVLSNSARSTWMAQVRRPSPISPKSMRRALPAIPVSSTPGLNAYGLAMTASSSPSWSRISTV